MVETTTTKNMKWRREKYKKNWIIEICQNSTFNYSQFTKIQRILNNYQKDSNKTMRFHGKKLSNN